MVSSLAHPELSGCDHKFCPSPPFVITKRSQPDLGVFCALLGHPTILASHCNRCIIFCDHSHSLPICPPFRLRRAWLSPHPLPFYGAPRRVGGMCWQAPPGVGGGQGNLADLRGAARPTRTKMAETLYYNLTSLNPVTIVDYVQPRKEPNHDPRQSARTPCGNKRHP